MNRGFKIAVAMLILAAGFAGSVAAGPLEDGVAAGQRGDYATAMQRLRPLADQGNAIAQVSLGLMYSEGQGVQQDYAAALSWYRKAADQGLAIAQVYLGTMYAIAQGVPQNYAEAAQCSSTHLPEAGYDILKFPEDRGP
jgi:TPR repeat protein